MQGATPELLDAWKRLSTLLGIESPYMLETVERASDEIERLRAQNIYLADALTKIVEDVQGVLRKSTAEIVQIGKSKSLT